MITLTFQESEFTKGYIFTKLPNSKTGLASSLGVQPKSGDIWECNIEKELPKITLLSLEKCLHTSDNSLSDSNRLLWLSDKADKIVKRKIVGNYEIDSVIYDYAVFDGIKPIIHCTITYKVSWINRDDLFVTYESKTKIAGWNDWDFKTKGKFFEGNIALTLIYKSSLELIIHIPPTGCSTYRENQDIFQIYVANFKLGSLEGKVACSPVNVNDIVPVLDLDKIKKLRGNYE